MDADTHCCNTLLMIGTSPAERCSKDAQKDGWLEASSTIVESLYTGMHPKRGTPVTARLRIRSNKRAQ